MGFCCVHTHQLAIRDHCDDFAHGWAAVELGVVGRAAMRGWRRVGNDERERLLFMMHSILCLGADRRYGHVPRRISSPPTPELGPEPNKRKARGNAQRPRFPTHRSCLPDDTDTHNGILLSKFPENARRTKSNDAFGQWPVAEPFKHTRSDWGIYFLFLFSLSHHRRRNGFSSDSEMDRQDRQWMTDMD